MVGSWVYPVALAIASLAVATAEAIAPWRRAQRRWRKHLPSDLVHLVVNGHFLSLGLFALASRWVLPPLDHALARAGIITHVYRNLAAGWPLAAQIVVALVVIDFLQWGIHNLLHRVPWLWELHKTHHSVEDGEMDFIVSFRFHWGELVVYRTLLYLPLAWLGFRPTAVLVHAIVGTVIGHLNHANLDIGRGWWRYLINSPRMHVWHHDYDASGRSTVNFGIIFSCWDWLFGTAKMPEQPPARLGFAGGERFPTSFFAQAAWPLSSVIRQPVAASLIGVAIFAGGWLLGRAPGAAPLTPMFGERAASSQPAADHHLYAGSSQQATAAIERFGGDARAAGYQHPEDLVSVGELAAALGSPRLALIDVRPKDAFAAGHIPSAQRVFRQDYSTDEPIPGMSRDRAALEAMLRKVGVAKDSVVVLYGDGGPEPYRLWWTLRAVGGLHTRVLDGGLRAWKADERGIAEGPARALAAGDVVLPGSKEPAPLDWRSVETVIHAPGTVLVDARSEREYDGKVKHPEAARAGHIPGAKNLEWVTLLSPDDDRLAPPAELRSMLANVGIDGKHQVVSYCQTGTRSSVIYFALRQLGVPDDKLVNYNGSWSEYSRLGLPVDQR